jgi:NOL1/NOP2/sun family putative RNA methylase
MRSLLGNEYPEFAASLESEPSRGVRFNPLKLTRDQFQVRFQARLKPLSWCPTGFSYETARPGFQPGKHPDHVAGLYYLQEPSAMAAAELLAPQPGQRVLDLAAAPGGKSTQLAALMNNQGWLLANEIHPKRAWTLAENLERWGITCASITNETPERLAGHFGDVFDSVLVDAPCSGEALFRRNPEAAKAWSPEAVSACASRQRAILLQAARLVAPGGRLGYITCTFNPEEDEAVLEIFLENNPDFHLVELPSFNGFSPGRPDWLSGNPIPELAHAIRLWPHHAEGEGHFIAVMQRARNAQYSGSNNKQRSRTKLHNQPESLEYFHEFCRVTLIKPIWQGELLLAGSYLYELPPASIDLSGLTIIHHGRWLGAIKKGRFEPSHAFALSLEASQVRRVVSFKPGDPQLARYMRGEIIVSHEANGWCLVCVDCYPIGWGKISAGRLKSHFPKGLRWS